ncbi:MAG TPA: hypothetical protein G4O06_06935 [Dehalococcoidia bacterium]|nr:hypothetical protein [Dehalococcoidia bacterium]
MQSPFPSSDSFAVEGYKPQPFPEMLWPVLSKLDLKLMDTYLGYDVTTLRNIKTPMVEGYMMIWAVDKVKRLSLSHLVFMKRMVFSEVGMGPNEDYDFPLFSSELVENPANAHFLADMHAMRDIVIDTWYREKYLDPLDSIWKEYQDVNNDINPNPWYRAFQSPYSISGRHKPQDGDRSFFPRIIECLVKYLEYYIGNVLPQATPIESPEVKEYVKKRKYSIMEQYRTLDPGAGPIMKSLGIEEGKKLLEVLFS